MAQGNGILQPHHLIDELDNVAGDEVGRQKLSDGPFGQILKSAQVNSVIHSVHELILKSFLIEDSISMRM